MTAFFMSNAVVAARWMRSGVEHFKRNEFDAAIAAFDQVLQLVPDDTYARWNRATALLSLGHYARGFKEHDVAWRLFHWRGFGPVGDDIDRLQALPLWQGESGARLLLYHELGFGDAIMVMRYLPALAERAKLTLVIDLCLARLARSFDGVEVLGKVPGDLSQFDYRLPLFAALGVLEQTADSIPAEPYIGMNLPRAVNSSNRIGIAWSGRTQTAFSASYFLAMLDHHDFRLYALQPGEAPDIVEPLRPGSDFADVADLIAEMDHIVSIDTAAIHLAGAMGHPSAHLLLPFLSDWRWHHTARWYPHLKTYRQDNEINWSAPFARLNEVLHGEA